MILPFFPADFFLGSIRISVQEPLAKAHHSFQPGGSSSCSQTPVGGWNVHESLDPSTMEPSMCLIFQRKKGRKGICSSLCAKGEHFISRVSGQE